MNPFDELTLGEVDSLINECLAGKSIEHCEPLHLAGGVMYMHQKRDEPDLVWGDFMKRTKMGDIKAFSEMMSEEAENPSNGSTPSSNLKSEPISGAIGV